MLEIAFIVRDSTIQTCLQSLLEFYWVCAREWFSWGHQNIWGKTQVKQLVSPASWPLLCSLPGVHSDIALLYCSPPSADSFCWKSSALERVWLGTPGRGDSKSHRAPRRACPRLRSEWTSSTAEVSWLDSFSRRTWAFSEQHTTLGLVLGSGVLAKQCGGCVVWFVLALQWAFYFS